MITIETTEKNDNDRNKVWLQLYRMYIYAYVIVYLSIYQ